MRPLLKWVGGKRRLLPEIRKRLPPDPKLYVEPFLGGASVLLDLQPRWAVVGDVNPELVNLYRVVRETPEELISHLETHTLSEERFYEVRAWDRSPTFLSDHSPVERASRLVFLNKTCFNGLWRVNPSGQNNVPWGRPKVLRLPEPDHVRAVSVYLRRSVEVVLEGPYGATGDLARAGTCYYLDPPYLPLSFSESFTGYAVGGFGWNDHVRLDGFCRAVRDRGASFLLSNSDTPHSRALYSGLKVEVVSCGRSMGGKGSVRKTVSELLVSPPVPPG